MRPDPPRCLAAARIVALALALCASSLGCLMNPAWVQPPHAAGEPPHQQGIQPAVDIIATMLMLVGALIVNEAGTAAFASDPDPVLSSRYWEDPDDWIADCPGPYNCPEYQLLQCSGTPGRCDCRCGYEGTVMGAR